MSDVKEKVATFLRANKDMAFTTSEISEAIEEKKTTVNNKLLELESEDKVVRAVYDGLIHNSWKNNWSE